MKISLVVASSVALVTLLGCSKPSPEEQKKKEEALAAAMASAFAMPSTAPSAAGAKPTGDSKTILGTCMRKSAGTCTEYRISMSPFEDDLCKGADGSGVLTKGSTPCPREKLIGTCEVAPDEFSAHTDYHYKGDGASATT